MNKKLILVFVFVCVLFSGVIVYSWFEHQEFFEFIVQPGEYEINVSVYLDDVLLDTESDCFSNPACYDIDNNLLILNAFSEDAFNYIDKLRIHISVKSHNHSRLRFRILDEWQLVRRYTFGDTFYYVVSNELYVDGVRRSPYKTTLDFFQKNDDPHYYYNGTLGKNQEYEANIILGGYEYPTIETTNYTEEVYVRLAIVVEMIQSNRAHKVWNIPINWFE